MVRGFDVKSDAMLLLLLPVVLSVGAEGDMVNAYVGMGAGGEDVALLSASRVLLSSFGMMSIFGSKVSLCCVGIMGADCV